MNLNSDSLPVLCPASGCNRLLGYSAGEEFEPADLEFVVATAYEPNGVKVWELRCACGRERRWPQ